MPHFRVIGRASKNFSRSHAMQILNGVVVESGFFGINRWVGLSQNT
jgi:hypothetical protein